MGVTVASGGAMCFASRKQFHMQCTTGQPHESRGKKAARVRPQLSGEVGAAKRVLTLQMSSNFYCRHPPGCTYRGVFALIHLCKGTASRSCCCTKRTTPGSNSLHAAHARRPLTNCCQDPSACTAMRQRLVSAHLLDVFRALLAQVLVLQLPIVGHQKPVKPAWTVPNTRLI